MGQALAAQRHGLFAANEFATEKGYWMRFTVLLVTLAIDMAQQSVRYAPGLALGLPQLSARSTR